MDACTRRVIVTHLPAGPTMLFKCTSTQVCVCGAVLCVMNHVCGAV